MSWEDSIPQREEVLSTVKNIIPVGINLRELGYSAKALDVFKECNTNVVQGQVGSDDERGAGRSLRQMLPSSSNEPGFRGSASQKTG